MSCSFDCAEYITKGFGSAEKGARGHYYRLFRHELEVQYGVTEEVTSKEREGVSADSIMVKRERGEAVAAD